jgi:hypothetical protein
LTENKNCEKLKGWEIRVRDPEDEDNFVELTSAQAALLMEGFTPIYGELKRDLPIIACLRAKAILARWRDSELKRLREKELYFEQQQQQQQAAAATTEQQQQDEALAPPAAEAEQLEDEEILPALEEQQEEEDDDFDMDHESDPMDHVEGETEQLAVMLVGFVEARTIVTEMNEHGHDVGTPIPTRDEITHTILTTTKQNKHVVITYYANGLEDEDSYVEGTAVKVGGSEWMTCVTGLPRGAIYSSTDLADATKWMVHRPVEFFTSKEQATQMARIKRLDRCERGRINEVAKKNCRSDRELRKKEEFDKMIQRVQGGRYEFDDFNKLWKLAEDPFEKTYQVYNRRTKETEEVRAVIKGNEENATSTLVLGALSEVLNSNNKRRQAASEGQRKKQKLGVVNTILGEDAFSALAKLRQDSQTLRANDGDTARKKLTDGYRELKKNYDAFQNYAAEKRASSGIDDLDLSIVSSAIDKSKGMDHYLRVFFPKCGLLSKNNNAKEDFINNGHVDGRHNFKLTPVSIEFRLEQIREELQQASREIAEGEPAANQEDEEVEEPDVFFQDADEPEEEIHMDDASVLSFESMLSDGPDDDASLGDIASIQC